MRRMTLIPVLLMLVLSGCDDLTRIGGRSLDGSWTTRIDGEQVWIDLRDDGREIRGSGEWGWDRVYVTGHRHHDELHLIFEFTHYTPIEFEGRVISRELEGRLYGSGYRGDLVRFRRDSWR